MKPQLTLIIGYGNTLRSDDGFGCVLIDLLEERATLRDAEFVRDQQLLPEMAESLRDAQLAVFLDARVAEKEGTLFIERVVAQPAAGGFSHHLNPASLLAMTQSLYGAAPAAFLVSVSTSHFDFGETLSEPVADMLPVAASVVETLVNHFATHMEGKANDKNIDTP